MTVTDWSELSIELNRLSKKRDNLLNLEKFKDALIVQDRINSVQKMLTAWLVEKTA